MITRDPTSGGYWVIRPQGDVYAFDGAPFLGPTPQEIEAWGIGPGAPIGPVVGITTDGAGGFTFACDTDNFAPGQIPHLYTLPVSGVALRDGTEKLDRIDPEGRLETVPSTN